MASPVQFVLVAGLGASLATQETANGEAAVRTRDDGTRPAAFAFADAWAEVRAGFVAACEQARVVGASLMFVEGDQVRGFEAFGLADRAAGRPVDRDTIYHWASITKTFTGIAVMQLRDRGRLRLEQPIVGFLPELREVHDPLGKVEAIELRHLLAHAAGFRGPTWPWGGKPWHPHEPTHFSQLVAMLPYTEVEFVPGSRYSYSNLGSSSWAA